MTNYKDVKNLYVLPFDHRSGFAKLLGFEEPLNEEQINKIKDYKHVIYEAIFKSSVPKDESAVLVDEVYGLDILKDAKEKGLITMQTVEKSGQDKFQFEYGPEYQKHLLDIMPTYAKVLIRYDVKVDNKDQIKKLRELSDFVHANGIGLLIEPLMQDFGDKFIYDHSLRYMDVIKMIMDMQNAGVEADVWKIEGFYEESQYKEVAAMARRDDREKVKIIILGRNETRENVKLWIEAGRNICNGFAVGRTIFWQPLSDFKDGKISREEAINKIAKDYEYYYNIFIGQKEGGFWDKMKSYF